MPEQLHRDPQAPLALTAALVSIANCCPALVGPDFVEVLRRALSSEPVGVGASWGLLGGQQLDVTIAL